MQRKRLEMLPDHMPSLQIDRFPEWMWWRNIPHKSKPHTSAFLSNSFICLGTSPVSISSSLAFASYHVRYWHHHLFKYSSDLQTPTRTHIIPPRPCTSFTPSTNSLFHHPSFPISTHFRNSVIQVCSDYSAEAGKRAVETVVEGSEGRRREMLGWS